MREKNDFTLNRSALPKSIWKCEACYQESDGDELYVIDGDFRSPEAGYFKRFQRAIWDLLNNPGLPEKERLWRSMRVSAIPYPWVKELPPVVTKVDGPL